MPSRRPVEGFQADAVLDAPLSVVTGPLGSYSAEALAWIIEQQGRWQDCVWLRPDHASTAVVTELLTTACRRRWVAGSPEPAASGADAAAHPEAALIDVLRVAPAGAVVVIELPRRAGADIDQLLRRLRPTASDVGISMVAVTERRTTGWLAPHPDRLIAAAAMHRPAEPPPTTGALPGSSLRRLERIAGGRVTIVDDVVDAATCWPPDAITAAVGAARHWRALVDRVTGNLLELADLDRREALETCVATGYWHPQFATNGLSVAELRPWLVPLEQQWGWLRPVWRRPLARRLRVRSRRRVAPARAVVAAHQDPAPRTTSPERRPLRPVAGASATGASVEARLLGNLELRVDGVAVATAPAPRGFAVLRYVLARPYHAASRDELLEEFWPDVDPAVARNRLQVAVSSVRRALRDVTRASVFEYRGGAYGTGAHVALDVDVERFEAALTAARAADHAREPDRALASYQQAIDLYRGDFAADAPYEQWTLLPRESLRLRYVDALDRISGIQLAAGRIDECIATAHRMLDVDPYREDAHRLLMRCYARQGRIHQAMRQYELCWRVLDTTLEVAPSAETVGLRDAIRLGHVTAA